MLLVGTSILGGSLKCAEFLTGVWSKCNVNLFLLGVLCAEAASFVTLLTGTPVTSPSTLSWPFTRVGLGSVFVTSLWAFSENTRLFSAPPSLVSY